MGFGWKNLYYIVGVVYGTVVLLKRGGGWGGGLTFTKRPSAHSFVVSG
jgi:hypothetical protein